LPFPDRGAKVEEIIGWVVGEVKVVPDTVWRLNNNFTILGIEGVLNILNGEGCLELGQLCNIAASRDATMLEDVPKDMRMLVWQIMRSLWKPHGLSEALRRLESAHAATVSHCDD
jgi:hypothetical protein